MNCKHCNAEVNVLDSFCPACGKSLSILADKPVIAEDDSDNLLGRISDNLESELGKAEKALLVDLEIPGSSKTKREQKPPFFSNDQKGVLLKFDNLHPLSDPDSLLSQEFALIETPVENIQHVTQFVFNSPYVQFNLQYKTIAGQTSLLYLSDVPIVNAFASHRKDPNDPLYPLLTKNQVEPPFIIIFGGICNATRLAATALGIVQAQKINNDDNPLFLTVMKAIGERVVANEGTFSLEEALIIYRENNLAERFSDSAVKGNVNSNAFAMNMTVIAHELGHIALGHTLRVRDINYEVQRNQEREADSFSASVASSSPFADYAVAGGICWWMIMTWIGSITGNQQETTHPHARERLMDFIRANRDQAASIGITEDNINEFLP